MNFSNAFIDLEQKIEHLVSRYTKLKETNDALRREVAYIRQENQRLQRERDEIEERISRIIERVENNPIEKSEADTSATSNENHDDFDTPSLSYEREK